MKFFFQKKRTRKQILLSDLLYLSKENLTAMLYNKIENTYILDVDDAILLYGKKEYNKLRKSGDIYIVNMKSLKPQKERTVKSLFAPDKIRTSNKRVMCIETGEMFDSIREANVKYGFNISNICAVCKGKQKTAYGYHWRYVN